MPITVHRKNIGSFYWTTSGANKILPGICGTTTNAFFIDPTVINSLGGTIYSTFTQSQLQSNFAFTTSSDVTATAANFLDTVWAANGWNTSNDWLFNAQLYDFIRNNFGQYSINPEDVDLDLILSRGYIYNTDSATSLLMHFDSNLTDSSQYNIAYSNFSAINFVAGKFGQAANFNGTSSNIQIPAGSSGGIFDFASGNWTIDFWFNTSSNDANQHFIIGGDWQVYLQNDKIVFSDGGSNTLTTTSSYTVNVWNHVAIVNNGGTLTIYLNGVSAASTAFSAPIAFTNTIWLGEDGTGNNWYSGELDELRVTKGSALWSTGFSVPSSAYNLPLHSIPWVYFGNEGDTDNFTSLLLHFDSSVPFTGYDSSQNNINPSFSTTCGLTSVNSMFGYSSLWLDGTNNGTNPSCFMNLGQPASLNFGSGAFTFECWFNYSPALVTSQMAIFGNQYLYSWMGLKINNGVMGYYATSSTNGTFWNMLNGDSGGNAAGNIPIIPNQWNHVVFQRSGNVWSGYINGQLDMQVTVSGTVSNTQSAIFLGAWGTSGQGGPTTTGFPGIGYIDETRFSNVARYSGSSFTVPNAPFVADSNTEVLFHFESAGILDSSNNNYPATSTGSINGYVPGIFNNGIQSNGVAQILYANPANSPIDISTSDFTVEMWFNTSTGNVTMFSMAGASMSIGNNTNNTATYNVGSANPNTAVSVWTTNAWNHIALSRRFNTTFLYINGKQVANGFMNGGGNRQSIGVNDLQINWSGIIDEYRLSKGIARYTPEFTVPSAPYSNDANTALLMHLDGNANDSSTNANNGTAVGSVTYTTGNISSQAAVFTTSSSITVPNSSQFNFGTNPFTVDFWVNIQAYPTVNTNVQLAGVSGQWGIALNYVLGHSPGSLFVNYVGLFNGGDTNFGNIINYVQIPLNTWTHIALVCYSNLAVAGDNNTQGQATTSSVLFINGVPTVTYSYSSTATLSYGSGSPITLGGFNGYMEEFRISSGARYLGNFTPQPYPFY